LKLAENYQIPFYILSCHAEQKIIKTRLRNRQNNSDDISDADVSIMHKQLKNSHHLGIDEKKYEISIDTGLLTDYSSIVEKLNYKYPNE
jgi:predicted kinase